MGFGVASDAGVDEEESGCCESGSVVWEWEVGSLIMASNRPAKAACTELRRVGQSAAASVTTGSQSKRIVEETVRCRGTAPR